MFLIALLAAFALTGMFAVQNGGSQVFYLAGYSQELPTWAPTAIGVTGVSVLLMLVKGHLGLGSRVRELRHSREINEHRHAIESLRAQNAALREELAAAKGRLHGASLRGAAASPVSPDRSVVGDVPTA